jgi:hypothetical protein
VAGLTRAPRLARALTFVLATGLVGAAVACGPPAPAAVPAREPLLRWQDLYDGTPEVMLVLHPQAILRDPVYGPLYQGALRGAIARGAPSQLSLLQAIDDAEEILVVGRRSMQDATIVIRGARADRDPAKIADPGGAPLFRATREGSAGGLRQLERTGPEAGTVTLYVTGRTWILVTGGAQARAREVIAHPGRRPEPVIPSAALAALRIEGGELVSQIPALRKGALQKVGDGLVALSVLLQPGREGVVVKLEYANDDQVAWAHRKIEEAVEILRARGARWAFLEKARVTRNATDVTIAMPLPEQLVNALPGVTGADLAL